MLLGTAQMTTYLTHPLCRGSLEELGGGRAYWLTFFFGPIYLAVKRAYGAALLHAACAGVAGYLIVSGLRDFPYDRGGLALAMILVGDFILAAAFFDTPVRAYRRRGWREIEERREA
jgi:hypothetical protein